MKLRKTLTGILGVSMMALSVGSFSHVNEHKEVWAATDVVVKVNIGTYAGQNGWSNDKKFSTINLDDNISITATGGTNTGKYYTSGSNWRMYQTENPKIKISAINDCTLSYVKFTYSVDKNGVLTYAGANKTSGTKIDLTGSEAIFGVGNTGGKNNGQVRFTNIEVGYISNEVSTHECVFDQKVVDLIHRKSEPTCVEPAYYFLSCKECGKNNGTDVFAYGEPAGHDTDELGYCSVCKGFDEQYTIADRAQMLLNKYNTLDESELGKYNRHTLININDSTIEEATAYFHAKVNMLERTTHFTNDALWMTNEAGTYSYYGTKGEDLTGGRVANVGDTVDSIALKNVGGMEGHYTTLSDIKNGAVNAEWTYDKGVYSTSDENIIKLFLDFTAPCFLNFDEKTANYIILDHVSIKEEGNKLVLKLHVNSGDASKLKVVDVEKEEYVLSTATISKYSVQQNDALSDAVTITFDNTAKRKEYTTTVQVWEENDIVVTNTKGSSTSNVGDFSNPARFYKNSKIEITCNAGKFTTIIINSPTDEYLTALTGSLTSAGIKYTVSAGTVTITFNEPTDKLSFTASGGQCRFNSITCK